MGSDLFVLTLLRAQVAASLAILIVLALRGPARRMLRPALAYQLWLLVPVAMASSLFPTWSEFRHGGVAAAPLVVHAITDPVWLQAFTRNGFWADRAPMLLEAWLAGAAGMALVFLAGELRFRGLARRGLAGPAVVGVAAPRLVVPYDYHRRFTATERVFIRRHERAHIERGDPLANLAIAALQAIGWFNPLVHLAAGKARLDQELACDFTVVEGRPQDRRPYGEALLKVSLAARSYTGLACAWSPAGRHPLELRLGSLRNPDPSLRRYLAGAVGLGAAAVTVAATVWIVAPSQQALGPALSAQFSTQAQGLAAPATPAPGLKTGASP